MDDILKKINYLVGDTTIIEKMANVPSKQPFDEGICDFLTAVSDRLMKDGRSRVYPDVVTLGFWIRKASLSKLKEQYLPDDGRMRLGSGVAFHIAPSNVPVNFAYSLVSGLLTGNANVVRVPSKDFEQVGIIADAINGTLEEHPGVKPYIALVRYDRDRDINDQLSAMADVRIIWGGDQTIAELRKSPLPPRSTEITFADRYSLAVIDADLYMGLTDKDKVASDFFNDTYLTDQNACTSPRVVVWTGKGKEEAKTEFWKRLYDLVKAKYSYQDIMGVNKLTSAYLAAAGYGSEDDAGLRVIPHDDNLLVRVHVDSLSAKLMDYRENCGYFYEYDCDEVMDLFELCNDKRCQTIGLIGNSEWLKPLFEAGIKGVDRIVPVGKTMDFDLIWDGYELMSRMTRVVSGV